MTHPSFIPRHNRITKSLSFVLIAFDKFKNTILFVFRREHFRCPPCTQLRGVPNFLSRFQPADFERCQESIRRDCRSARTKPSIFDTVSSDTMDDRPLFTPHLCYSFDDSNTSFPRVSDKYSHSQSKSKNG